MPEIQHVANIRGPIGYSYKPRQSGAQLVFDTYQKDKLIAKDTVVVDLPPGPTPDITMKAKGIAFGLQPTVTKSGTPLKPVFELGVPAGATGPAPKLQPGTITSVPYGSTPTLGLRELAAGSYAVDMGIPAGATGPKGDTGSAAVSIVDSPEPSTTTTWPSSRIALEARDHVNLIPNGIGEWGGLGGRFQAPLIYETTDKPAELSACYRTVAGQGTDAPSGKQQMFAIDPSQLYRATFWCKADIDGSRMVIEIRDQDNNHAVESGTINGSANYFMWGLPVPTTWTKYESTMKFRPGAKTVGISSIYFNYGAGATTQNAAQSFAMRLVPVGPVASHTHPVSEVTGVLPASQVPSLDKLQGSVTAAQVPTLSELRGTVAAGQLPEATTTARGGVWLATPSEVRQAYGSSSDVVAVRDIGHLRHWTMTDAQRLALTTAEKGTSPLHVYCTDTRRTWRWTGTEWTTVQGDKSIFIGASNVVTGTWPTKLCARYGWREANYAVGGTGFLTGAVANRWRAQTNRAVADLKNDPAVGRIFVAGGGVDAINKNTEIDTEADYVLSTIRKTWPEAELIVVPGLWRHIEVTPELLDVACRMRSVAQKHRATVVWHAWEWLWNRADLMEADGAHPNSAGYDVFTDMISASLEGTDEGAYGRVGYIAHANAAPESSIKVWRSDGLIHAAGRYVRSGGFVSGGTVRDAIGQIASFEARPKWNVAVRAVAGGGTPTDCIIEPGGMIRIDMPNGVNYATFYTNWPIGH